MKKIVVFVLFSTFFFSFTAIAQRGGGNGNYNNSGNNVDRRAFNRAYSLLVAGNFNAQTLRQRLDAYTTQNRLTSEQTKMLTMLLPDDRSKSEYLNFAYRYVSDNQNYTRASEVFESQEAEDAFLRFVARSNGNGGNNNSGGNYGNSNNNGNNNGGTCQNGNSNGYYYSLSDREFEDIFQRIKKEWYENNKVEVAKFAIKAGGMTTRQLERILKIMYYDNNRLELAKFAYQYLYDPKSAYLLADDFYYNSNKQSYMEFLRRQG